MLSQLFYWLLSMSVNGAAAGVLVLLLCRIKALPRRLTLALWIIPLLRLLVPFSVSGRFGPVSYTHLVQRVYDSPGDPRRQ